MVHRLFTVHAQRKKQALCVPAYEDDRSTRQTGERWEWLLTERHSAHCQEVE